MRPNSLIQLRYYNAHPVTLGGLSAFFKLFLRIPVRFLAHLLSLILKFKFLVCQILNFINTFLYILTISVLKIYNSRNLYSFRRIILQYDDCPNIFETQPINQLKPTNSETNCYFTSLSLCLFILYRPLF